MFVVHIPCGYVCYALTIPGVGHGSSRASRETRPSRQPRSPHDSPEEAGRLPGSRTKPWPFLLAFGTLRIICSIITSLLRSFDLNSQSIFQCYLAYDLIRSFLLCNSLWAQVATLALGFGYSALIVPAPLLTLLGVGASYWVNKVWLLRAASSGWIRGASAEAQTRVRRLFSQIVTMHLIFRLIST